MFKYQLRFWFEHSGICIWGMNDAAKEKYGYAIENSSLPISNGLINELNILEGEYATYLDWDCPSNPSPWTEQQKIDFKNRAANVLNKLETELGSDFIIQDEIKGSFYE